MKELEIKINRVNKLRKLRFETIRGSYYKGVQNNEARHKCNKLDRLIDRQCEIISRDVKYGIYE